MKPAWLWILTALLTACRPLEASPAPPSLLPFYISPAAERWRQPAYDCAAAQGIALEQSSPAKAILLIGLGEVGSPAYILGEEEIWVVGGQNVGAVETAEEAQALLQFGEEVWVFAPETDVQILFEQGFMQGAPLSNGARLAANPQEMITHLSATAEAVGILPGWWLQGAVQKVFRAVTAPALAHVSGSHPAAEAIVACLQAAGED